MQYGGQESGYEGSFSREGGHCAPVGEWKRLGCEGRPAWPGANSQHPPSSLHPRPRGSHAGRGACGPGSSCRAPDGARDALRRDGQAAGRRGSGPELQDRPGQGLQPDGPTSFPWERLASASEMGGRCSGERVRTGRPAAASGSGGIGRSLKCATLAPGPWWKWPREARPGALGPSPRSPTRRGSALLRVRLPSERGWVTPDSSQ